MFQHRNGLALVALVLLNVCALASAQSSSSRNPQLPSVSLVYYSSTYTQASETRGNLPTTTNPSANPTIIGSPGTPTSDSTTPTVTLESSSSSSMSTADMSSITSSMASSSSSSSTMMATMTSRPDGAMSLRPPSSPVALAGLAAALLGAAAVLA